MKKKTTPQTVPISITGRHFDVPPALRDYAVNKLGRLQKYFERIMEAHVIVSKENLQQIAEVNISANGFSISGKGKTPDIFASVDQVVDKLERQLKKHREKQHERKRMASKSKRREKEIILPFTEEFSDRDDEVEIVKVERVGQKPMSPDEALMQIEIIQKPFLAFINSMTEELNVIYRRTDGHYTLITS